MSQIGQTTVPGFVAATTTLFPYLSEPSILPTLNRELEGASIGFKPNVAPLEATYVVISHRTKHHNRHSRHHQVTVALLTNAICLDA